MLKIGSHVSMKGPHYLLGAIQEAESYEANALMIYSGPPQNTRRVDMEKYRVEEAYEYLKETQIPRDNLILHAPYIINLANTTKPETFELAVNFLRDEVVRAQYLDIDVIVLHPGSHVGAGEEVGIARIIEGLNLAMNSIDMKNTVIALETMAGKGSEIGRTFDEIRTIIDGVDKKESIGVCLDTCHIHDAGYDVADFDAVLEEFDRIIGIDQLKVLHINDSKNVRGARKDRHANLDKGEIGLESLLKVLYHPKLMHLPKILETPYIENLPPYKEEIALIRENAPN